MCVRERERVGERESGRERESGIESERPEGNINVGTRGLGFRLERE